MTFMWRKVTDGLWCIEDADGIPAALVTHLDDGTSLAVAEQWWAASQRLVNDLSDSSTIRDWLKRQSSDDDEQEGN